MLRTEAEVCYIGRDAHARPQLRGAVARIRIADIQWHITSAEKVPMQPILVNAPLSPLPMRGGLHANGHNQYA